MSDIENNDREFFGTIDWLQDTNALSIQQNGVATSTTPTRPDSSQDLDTHSVGIPKTTANIGKGDQTLDAREVAAVDDRDRTVKRTLRGIHVFMITISGVLGVGLYVRSGTILRIGGPGAVLIAFTVVGLLAWLVMQCLSELLCIWPISGSLVHFVETFIDEDLGLTVGVAYWFTYAINFAAMFTAAAGEVDFWNPGKAIQGTIIFFLAPAFMIFFNSFGIRIYAFTEVVGGSLKLACVLAVILSMIAINCGAGPLEQHIGTEHFKHDNMFPHESGVADNWVTAFFISLSIAGFAFVGVEITATTALEAQMAPPSNRRTWHKTSFRFSATWTPFIAWIIYFVGGLMLSLNVQWKDPGLPVVSWLGSPVKSSSVNGKTNSGFVVSAENSKIPGLADVFTVFLLITALTAANTNLYVASRALFGLTREVDDDAVPWLAYFGRTNRYQVPVRAMLVSCIFLWIPFLYLSPNNSPDTTIANLLEVLSQMGSVSCITVWACECWAFIRFYNCIKRHQAVLERNEYYAHVCRFRPKVDEDSDSYPWRSHGQPFTMYIALAGCLFILVVADGASLWHGFHKSSFLSAYLAPLCFIALWICLKIYRLGGPRHITWRDWSLEDLSNPETVMRKIDRLDQIRTRASRNDKEEPIGFWNLWGTF